MGIPKQVRDDGQALNSCMDPSRIPKENKKSPDPGLFNLGIFQILV